MYCWLCCTHVRCILSSVFYIDIPTILNFSFFTHVLDCSYDCHKPCSDLVSKNCSPDKKLVKRIFGIDLTTLIKAHDQRRPAIVDLCIKEIESRGLQEEGIYRVPGYADDITHLRNTADNGRCYGSYDACIPVVPVENFVLVRLLSKHPEKRLKPNFFARNPDYCGCRYSIREKHVWFSFLNQV